MISSDEMPELLSMIAIEVGIEVAVKVAKHWGGSTIYVPPWGGDYPIHAEITQLIGEERAKLVVALLAPGSIYIPSCKSLLRKLDFAKAVDRGESVRDIALKLQVSDRTVRRLKAVMAT